MTDIATKTRMPRAREVNSDILPAAIYLAGEIIAYRTQIDQAPERIREHLENEPEFILAMEDIGERLTPDDIKAIRDMDLKEVDMCHEMVDHLERLLAELLRGDVARSLAHFEQQLETQLMAAKMTTETVRSLGLTCSERRLKKNARKERMLRGFIDTLGKLKAV